MKKRIVSALLCAALAAGTLLAGCGGKDNADSQKTDTGGEANTTADAGDGSESKYKDFITVDVFDALANYQGIQTGWFGKIVKDKFNMELNIIAPNVAGGGDTLFQTRSAAGNLGDLIISGTEAGRFKNMVKAGLLMDMTDLLKDKDVYKNYETAIIKANADAESEGVYAIPSEISNQSPEVSTDGIDPLVAPFVRWDAYKAAGYPEMKTMDDWIPVMKQMQENTPESDSGKQTYAISLFKDWDGNMMMCAKSYAMYYGYNELGFVLTKADGSDVQDIMQDGGEYHKALQFLFKANQEGLVDPESTTQNYDILSNKYRDGQILTSIWSWQGRDIYNNMPVQEGAKNADEIGKVHKELGRGFYPALIQDTKCYSYGCYSEGNAKSIIAIGSQAQDPERMADFIDWLYSSEGMEIAGQSGGAAGPENLTWEMKDGRPVYTEFGTSALPSNDVAVPDEWGGGSWKDGVSALNFKTLSPVDIDPKTNEPYMTSMWSSVLENNNTDIDKDWQDYAEGAKTTLEFLEAKDALLVAPGTSYIQPEESSDITTLRNQCKAVIVDNSWKMVFAKDEAEFDSIWKDTQDTVHGLGYEDVLAVDMKNAEDEAASRVEAVKNYNEANN